MTTTRLRIPYPGVRPTTTIHEPGPGRTEVTLAGRTLGYVDKIEPGEDELIVEVDVTGNVTDVIGRAAVLQGLTVSTPTPSATKDVRPEDLAPELGNASGNAQELVPVRYLECGHSDERIRNAGDSLNGSVIHCTECGSERTVVEELGPGRPVEDRPSTDG